jgi:Flp pilus assembly protein TadD
MYSVRQLRKAVKQSPGDARAWYDLGVALANENNLGETHDALKRALACAPGSAELCLMIGLSLDGLNDVSAAANAFLLACERDPSSPIPFTHVGSLMLKHGRNELAIEPLRRAVVLSDWKPESCILYGTALERQNEIDEALSHFHIAALGAPENLEALRPLARLLSKVGHIAGSIRAWRKVAELAPSDLVAKTALGIALSECGDHTGAVRQLAEVAQAKPDSAEALSDLGTALTRSGSHDAALRAHRSASVRKSSSAPIQLSLGVGLMAAGYYEEAMTAFCSVLAIVPDWALAHLNLALCYRELGDLVAARDTLLKASTLDPNAEDIKNALRETLIALAGGEVLAHGHQSQSPRPSSESSSRSSAERADSSRSPKPRYLTGEIQIFPIVEVLEFLKVSRSSGVLDVTSKQGRGLLCLQKGDLCGARSPGVRDLLDILVETKAITPDDLDMIAAAQGGSEASLLGLTLVDDGIITQSAFERALHLQLIDALRELISWKDGDFSFQDSSETTGANAFQNRVTVDTRAVVMEATRLLDESNRDGH